MENVFKKVDSLEMNELHRAVQNNCLEGVQFLVQNGADIANTIDGGRTPLHLSCSLNLPNFTKELLRNKPRKELRQAVNVKTMDTGTTALHLAMASNSLENARLLLGHGAQFDVRNNDNQSPRALSSEKSIDELISSIESVFSSTSTGVSDKILDTLNSCARDNLSAVMYARNFQDCTALQVAMGKLDLHAIGTIVDFRMENLQQNPWQPGVHLDKLMQHSKAARLRLSRFDRHSHEGVNMTEEDMVDLLSDVCEFLKDYKRQRNPSLADQPLLIIIEETLEFFGSWEASDFLQKSSGRRVLWKGVGFAVSMLKLCIVAPLQLFMRQVYTSELLDAARRNDSRLVEKCLTGHPDLNEADANDRTALRYAFKNENFEMAKTLLRLGADPTSDEEPLLHFALCRMKESKHYIDAEMMQLIFDRVSDDKLFTFVNSKSWKNGASALHWAARESNVALAQFLMSKGAIYCARDVCGCDVEAYSQSEDISGLMDFVDRSFAQARDGQAKELIHAMRKSGVMSMLAVAGTRNEEGQTLDRVAELAGHVEAAEKIRELMSHEQIERRKRNAADFFRYGTRFGL